MWFADSFRAARWFRTFNLVLQAILFVTLFAGLNYVALYFAWRFDLTRLHQHSLSAETKSYLERLNKPVLVVSTFGGSGEDEKYLGVSEDLGPLLREYIYATELNNAGKVKVMNLDVFQRPREAQQLGAEQNEVLVFMASKKPVVIHYEDLYRFNKTKRIAFLGEQAVTNAINQLASDRHSKIYFLAGHGELDPVDVRPEQGISVFYDQLTSQNYEIARLDLRQSRRVPDDATLLIAPRPTTPYEPYEQELLRQYLADRAGRMLIFISPPYFDLGLADLFYDWGVLADRAIVYDQGPAGQNDTGSLILRRFAKHPIMQPLLDQNLPLSFGLCRPVRVNPSRAADESLIVKGLIGLDDTAWGELNFRQNPPRFDRGVDLVGKALDVGIASERVGAKAQLNFSVPRGRLIVYGCSDFIVNNRIGTAGNLTLALSSVNWLADRETPVTIAGRTLQKYQLALTEQQLLRLRYSLLFGLPGIFALLGLGVYWTRRR